MAKNRRICDPTCSNEGQRKRLTFWITCVIFKILEVCLNPQTQVMREYSQGQTAVPHLAL